MNNEKCLVCKFHGKSSPSVSASTIYQSRQNQRIHLCYSHSVEFFKMGQVKFMLKYQHDFQEHGFSDKDLFQASDSSSLLTNFR
jgi:hypothetical protein